MEPIWILLEHSWQESKTKKVLIRGGCDGKGLAGSEGRLIEGLKLGTDYMGE